MDIQTKCIIISIFFFYSKLLILILAINLLNELSDKSRLVRANEKKTKFQTWKIG